MCIHLDMHTCYMHVRHTSILLKDLFSDSPIIIEQYTTLDTQFPLLAAAVVALFQSKSEHRNSNLRHS